jgi:hypothetical protein
MSTSFVARAALAAGVPPRFRYWSGHSGRRFLFTATTPDLLADFDEAVAIAVDGDRIVWIGEASALRLASASLIRGAQVYVHLLAATPEERRALVTDLQPAAQYSLPLAA